MNTGNTTRVLGINSMEVSERISDILYPSIDGIGVPRGYILVDTDKWQNIISLMALVHEYKSPLLYTNSERIDQTLEFVKAKQPSGITELQGAQIIYAGNDDEINNIINASTLQSYAMKYSDLNQLNSLIYTMTDRKASKKYAYLVPDSNPYISIPVATWLSNQGGLLLFYDDKNSMYDSSKEILKDIKLDNIYYFTDSNTKIDFNKELKDLNLKFTKMSGGKEEFFAVSFAKYYDAAYGIGWNNDNKRNDSGHNYILCAKEDLTTAAIASQLSVGGKAGALLWTDREQLSSITESFLWSMKPNFWVTPAEGPYNNLWVIGSNELIDYAVQARADFTQEIVPYETMGDQGVSGLDAISFIIVAGAICSALWITFHLLLRMSDMPLLTKLMWILAVLVLGPIGLLFYIISYYNIPWMKMNNNKMWLRPLWKQSIVATITGIAFGTSTMLALGFLITWFGLPSFPFAETSNMFIFGNPMILKMITIYIFAFILAAFLFMPALMIQMRGLAYKDALTKSIPNALIALTSVFIGRSISMWWLMMIYSPMMPEENNMLWWGFMQAATLIGFITAYLPNWKLVRLGKVMGTM
jgi:hypothetical protein